MTHTNTQFDELKPVLFAAFAKLSRQGYGVAPGDAMELMHEFYAHEWSGIEDNFDPDRGDFRGYLYRSFLYFARPRIISDYKRQQQLTPLQGFERISDEPKETTPIATHDQEVVRDAFGKLPEGDRDILALRIVDGLSERHVAKQLGMSRYKLRQASAHALARLSVEVGESNLSDETQWKFAKYFWGDERSLEDASDACGLTTHQGQTMLKTIVEIYANHLNAASASRSAKHERSAMSVHKMKEEVSIQDLLKALCESPGDTTLHTRVNARRKEVETFLKEHQDFDFPPYATQALYESLAGEQDIDSAQEDCYIEAIEQDVTKTRSAVQNSLLPNLPKSFRNPTWVKPSGMGVEVIAEMSWALSSVCRRLCRHHGSEVIIIKPSGEVLDADKKEIIRGEVLFRELHLATELPEEIMPKAVQWFVRTGRSHPRLILETKSKPVDKDQLRVELDLKNEEVELNNWWGGRSANERQLASG